MGYTDSYTGTGTFEHHPQSYLTDEDLDDTIRVREISFMSMYQGEDSIPVENDGIDEFPQHRKLPSCCFSKSNAL